MKSNKRGRKVFDDKSPLDNKIRLLNETNQNVVIKHDVLFLAHHPLHKVSVTLFTEDFVVETLYQYFNINLPDILKNSVRKRKLEFFSGRLAAKFALEPLGLTEFIIRKLERGEPLWPDNVNGSISHTGDKKSCTTIACITEVGPQAGQQREQSNNLGIDIETKRDNGYFEGTPALSNVFLSPQERSLIVSNKQPYIYLIAFSAKESVIKAVYTKYKVLLPFLSIEYRCINEDSIEFKIIDGHQYFENQSAIHQDFGNLIVTVNFSFTEQEVLTICTI